MWKIKVYVDHGYFQYSVKNKSSAIEHGETIMKNQTYRRSNDLGQVEIYRVNKVKIEGEGLISEYRDIFKST